MSTFSVLVLHNVGRDMFFRFHPKTSTLHHAHEFQVRADSPEAAANLIWTLANVGDAEELQMTAPYLSLYANQVTEYRARRNRSLSVSDVLIIKELGSGEPRLAKILVLAGVGHHMLEAVPDYTDGSNQTAVSKSYEAHQAFSLELR